MHVHVYIVGCRVVVGI